MGPAVPYQPSLSVGWSPRICPEILGKMEQRNPISYVHYSGFARKPNDHYATPDWVTEALLRHVRLRGPVWEPCCGTGAMAEVLSGNGYTVVASDLHDYGYGMPGVDIFACHAMAGECQSLVTNPPYGDTGSHKTQERSPTAMLDFVRHTSFAGRRGGRTSRAARPFPMDCGKKGGVAPIIHAVCCDGRADETHPVVRYGRAHQHGPTSPCLDCIRLPARQRYTAGPLLR